ncbi:MAG TPA: Rne/Rng family ribonuclease [Alphaproteobacteria bacterium]|nr:Rne/Rng family ribonuclease [Alphaproteobacteria bacterium]
MKKMLIDATHSDEQRVVLLDGNYVDDFEAETSGKTQTKSNIYVAHVSRVEPSLQAAFISYGAVRNGFLAFGEVHPAFFNLPKAEKAELLEELIDVAARRRQRDGDELPGLPPAESADISDEAAVELATTQADEPQPAETSGKKRPRRAPTSAAAKAESAKEVRGEEAKKSKNFERKPPIHRRYRIQDVLKEGQKILIQVVKEERGTKGAALTTYFSLPGRYTVLMPNTPYAGGISRKITDHDERRQLRDTYAALKIPNEMGLIIRTAGVGQEIAAIRRDYDNLTSLWSNITEKFAKEDDIQCVHEDGSLIIRAMRDMMSDDVEEVVIAGKAAAKTAKDYCKSLMPNVAKILHEHKEDTPLFAHYGVEEKLNQLHHSRVVLPSGGYLVINPTEALVAIDINSGRATQERNIEETAFKTNMEASEEIARQIRLRDLAGLIVVDFIDMEDHRNTRKVENAMRRALRRDRARIQFGNISDFGLMEISRQRLRPSFGESHFITCPHCQGSGHVHSPATAALMILRRLEDDDTHGADRVYISTSPEQVLWMLNHKRDHIRELESKYKFSIQFKADPALIAPDHRLDLTRVKSDGTETSQTINVSLREQPELPPELRMRERGRNRGRDRDNGGENRPKRDRDDDRPQRNEHRADNSDREDRNDDARDNNRSNRERGGKGRGRDRGGRDRNDRGGNRHDAPRRPQRISAEAAESSADATESRAVAAGSASEGNTNGKRPQRDGNRDNNRGNVRPARPQRAAAPVEDQPLLVQQVTVSADDNDAPAIKAAPRKKVAIKRQEDTDAADAPLQVEKVSDSGSGSKIARATAKVEKTDKPAPKAPKEGSILARLMGKQ